MTLLAVLERTARGPKKEGCFALWLTLRVAEGIGRADGPGERAHRRRVAALERRLSSLALPAPLRRALVASLAILKDATPEAAALALQQLAAPARDTLGAEAGTALLLAAKAAQDGPAAGT